MDTLRPYDLHRMALDHPDLLPLWQCVDLSGALDFHQTMEDNRERTPRSRFDRAAIAARSSRDRGAYVVESPPFKRTAIDERSGPRSWPDSGAYFPPLFLNF